ncbi:tetratricopeptide repeat protein 1-like [Ostrinia furnacalis]|uniref:tetratricopeptide repeat protein 1-like n=1 Tax=Ostrinia furnacalis TaxID=93504 RepID=UPI001038A905|nr:tetratricopeptide repeat protein 1-like [Ostrinia furnacalis]
MSERLKSTENVSNEDVIEDLTKDLKDSLNTRENLDEFVISPANSSSNDSPVHLGEPHKSDFTPYSDHIPLDDDKMEDVDVEKDGDGDKESDTDSIDEEELKDTELDLTDDQKEERKIIAEDLKVAGNNAFKDGEFERSIEKYTEGLKTCPLQYPQQRAILYCNRSAAKMKLEKYKQAIKDCSKAIELDDKYVKAYIRRAQSYEHTEKLDESLADYKKILELDPSHSEAHRATIRLPPLIEEKNEKLKAEMLGKLKDLGNMILKPFGLSTENFQLEQDPESKGYKINFKQ